MPAEVLDLVLHSDSVNFVLGHIIFVEDIWCSNSVVHGLMSHEPEGRSEGSCGEESDTEHLPRSHWLNGGESHGYGNSGNFVIDEGRS